MIELPEALTLAAQMRSALVGKTVTGVLPPTKAHKFCWYSGDPARYDGIIARSVIASAEGFGSFAELVFDNGAKLCINDGVNVRLVQEDQMPPGYQLAIRVAGGCALIFMVAMYGGIYLNQGAFDNEYYVKSKNAVSPLSAEFDGYYYDTFLHANPKLSAKAFLATEQRFPGIGNGVLQDILFASRIHPKRKLNTFTACERDTLLANVKTVLATMIDSGGRDTEKDLYGNAGGYRTRMSKNTLSSGCPVCSGAIIKEAYLGGSVYYCPNCQRLDMK